MDKSKEKQVGIIVQARMGSTRLPGKHMLNVLGRPLISYLMERLKRVNKTGKLILATTVQPRDDILAEFAQACDLDYFRGSEDDVLNRYLQAAKIYDIDIIVRISADCPLIDPNLIDAGIELFLKNPSVDYLSNCLERTYPRGMDFEIFTAQSLIEIEQKALKPEEREHVTPYYYQHPEQFKMLSITGEKDYSSYRWTVDTREDFKLIKTIIENIYPKNPAFTLNDLLELYSRHPNWHQINAHVQQKKLTEP